MKERLSAYRFLTGAALGARVARLRIHDRAHQSRDRKGAVVSSSFKVYD